MRGSLQKVGAVRRVRSVCLSRSGEGSNFLHGRIFESRGHKSPSLETSSLVPIDFGSAVVWFETETEPNRLYREWNRIEPLVGQDLPEQFSTGSDRKDNDSELDRTGVRFLSIGTGLNRIALFFNLDGNRVESDRTGSNRFEPV